MNLRMSIAVLMGLSGCSLAPDARAIPEELTLSGAQAPTNKHDCGMGGPSLEHLGRMLFFDSNLSQDRNQSCATCHAASVGWTGPEEAFNKNGGVYEGSVRGRFGNRKPPSAAYAGRSPLLTYSEQDGFVGGNFTDGRATGWDLGSAAVDQARGPFLNPVEQALPDAETLVQRACAAHYGHMLTRLFGADVCNEIQAGYAAIARAIAAFEVSSVVSAYSAKYDAVQRGEQQLSALEQQGLELFNGKAHCSQCHASTSDSAQEPAVFSDFGYSNIGVPKNADNPFYSMGPDINPDGEAWVDHGLAGFIRQLASGDAWRKAPHVPAAMLSLTAEKLSALADDSVGLQRVPTLRNVDRRPSAQFVKAYTHNGYFKTLQGLVHFYNTRDVLERCKEPLREADALAHDCWPAPEVAEHLDERVGDLQLTAAEEAALVAFLGTLSDTGTGDNCNMMGMHGSGMH